MLLQQTNGLCLPPGYGVCSTRMKLGGVAHPGSFNSGGGVEEEALELEASLNTIERKKKCVCGGVYKEQT